MLSTCGTKNEKFLTTVSSQEAHILQKSVVKLLQLAACARNALKRSSLLERCAFSWSLMQSVNDFASASVGAPSASSAMTRIFATSCPIALLRQELTKVIS